VPWPVKQVVSRVFCAQVRIEGWAHAGLADPNPVGWITRVAAVQEGDFMRLSGRPSVVTPRDVPVRQQHLTVIDEWSYMRC
jgi:hypothetical protein